ncbi:MAG: OsmC family protein [Planctomycetes bacterium]|nr:OsmC family protein [Planctomycetota bacterium]
MAKKSVVVEAKMGEGFWMESRMGEHVLHVDQPAAMGGTDKGPNPLQYFLLSLGGCIGAISRIVATQRKLPIRGISLRITGDLDTDVLMGKANGSRAGFGALEVHAEIDADMTAEEKKAFLAEVDKRCPISDNIANTTPIAFRLVQ